METRRLLVLALCGSLLSACATTRVPARVEVPNQAAAIAAAVILVVPDQAPAIAAAAIRGAPDHAADVTMAAVSAEPAQMRAIVEAAITAAPRHAQAIREAAAAAMGAEGLALPGPVSRLDERSEFDRQFMNGDRMRFPDIIR
jgi:hypothetical protein